MKRTILLVTMAILAIGVSYAAPVCKIDTLDHYIALAADGCTINDKLFSSFGYSISINGNAVGPDAAHVTVTPLPTTDFTNPGPGIRFSGAWGAGTGGTLDALFGFQVTVIDPKWRISDAHMVITGGLQNGGIGHIGETLFDLDNKASYGLSTALPDKLSDSVDIKPTTTRVTVSKDMFLSGQLTKDPNALATISIIDQYFTEQTGIPEPGTMLLMGGALLGLSLVRRRIG